MVTSNSRRWNLPFPPSQAKRILEDALGVGVYALSLRSCKGRAYLRVRAARATKAMKSRESTESASAPVQVDETVVAYVEAIGPAEAHCSVATAAQIAAARLADACAASKLIDSLAGEIVHSYGELHLLYELGEALTGFLAVEGAIDLMLEKITTTLAATWGEVRFEGTRQAVRYGPAATIEGNPEQPGVDDQFLTTTLRSSGEIVGQIVLARPRDAVPFSSSDAKVLDAVGTMVANAIRSALLREELVCQSDKLRESETNLAAVLANAAETILTIDEQGIVGSFNKAAEETFGYAACEVVGRHFRMLMPDAFYRDYVGKLNDYLLVEVSDGIRSRLHQALGRRKDGTIFPVEVSIGRFRTASRTVFIASARDITERKAWEETLQHQALYDVLTNFPNRTLLGDRLRQAISAEHQNDGHLALLVLDLDGFKEVNDAFGHQYGDLLLQQVGQRLQSLLRDADTVARLGGDEFAVLRPGASAADANGIAERLLASLEQPFTVEGSSVRVSASVGIALCPEHGLDADTLLRRADIAMYVAKRARNGRAVYSQDYDEQNAERLKLTTELRNAIGDDQLVLHYQPCVEVRTRRVARVEALARWCHPQRGLMSPDRFIPLAEQTGLMGPLTKWVLNAALHQQRTWHEDGYNIAVNLSAHNLYDPHLPDLVAEQLQEWKVAPEYLMLEITESSLIVDPALAMKILNALGEMGIRIAIDDFGTGYSSLALLKRIPVNEIKIDRSFVTHMARDDEDDAIVCSMIRLGHDLGLTVTAEGVEDQQTWDLLARLGCDMIQGYFVSRPLPAPELTRWLKDSPWAGWRKVSQGPIMSQGLAASVARLA